MREQTTETNRKKSASYGCKMGRKNNIILNWNYSKRAKELWIHLGLGLFFWFLLVVFCVCFLFGRSFFMGVVFVCLFSSFFFFLSPLRVYIKNTRTRGLCRFTDLVYLFMLWIYISMQMKMLLLTNLLLKNKVSLEISHTIITIHEIF